MQPKMVAVTPFTCGRAARWCCGWHEGPSAQAEGGAVPAARLQRRDAKHGPGGRSPSTGCLEHQGGQTLFQHIHARCQPARTPTRRPRRLYSIRPGRATHRRAPAVSRPQRIVLDSELAVVPHAGGCCRCRRAQQRGAGSALGGLRHRHRHCAAAAARRPVRRLLQHTTRRLAALTCGLLLQQRPQLQRQAGQLPLHVARLALTPRALPYSAAANLGADAAFDQADGRRVPTRRLRLPVFSQLAAQSTRQRGLPAVRRSHRVCTRNEAICARVREGRGALG